MKICEFHITINYFIYSSKSEFLKNKNIKKYIYLRNTPNIQTSDSL